MFNNNPQSPRRGSGGPKRQGEFAEAEFLNRAIRLGFAVAQPWGDSERYDFVVDAGERFWRVQVKSCNHRARGQYGYNFKAYSNARYYKRTPYSAAQIDILAAYLVPENLWYILPIEILENRLNFSLFPDNCYARGGNRGLGPIAHIYREAWWIFSGEGKPADE